MGSGLSIPDATTGWTDNSDQTRHFSAGLNSFLNTLRDKKILKETQEPENPTKKPLEDWGDLEEWMFDSINEEKDKLKQTETSNFDDEDQIPAENSFEGWFDAVPEFPSKIKRSPYVHNDQIIEEEEEQEPEYVCSDQQFGFKHLSSYISQMDKWIEEGKTFK